jgi:YHS domain-containing protein
MNMAKDPVCGMMVDEKKAKFKSDYSGKTFYFCAASCKATFDKSPAKFAGASSGKQDTCSCGGHC